MPPGKGAWGPNGLVSPGPSLSARSGFLFFVAVFGVVVFVRLIGGFLFFVFLIGRSLGCVCGFCGRLAALA